MIAVVRYYETLYLIRDEAGERIYTGNDEATAKRILKTLNAWRMVKEARKRKLGKLKKVKGKRK